MLFNSLTFLIFLPIVFGLYWFVCGRSARLQNALLIAVSYVFYGWLGWRFCGLLALSTISAYICGARIGNVCESTSRKRKTWLAAGIAINLGVLGFFKYYNFFVESLTSLFSAIGLSADVPTLKLVLPIGISFYSFMAISYMVDVFRATIKPVKEPIAFFSAMSFFPQLLAGPIGRMPKMLPQFDAKRQFDYELAVDGCRQMLWGFFKKIVIADGCATLTNRLFLEPSAFSGSVLALGVVMYAVQIYCDFSGYSDMAIGCGKLFGIRLMRNFAFPYFATNISDFWRRWHISLTTWFRDYVYIPLGGNRCSKAKQIRNIIIVFMLSGLWHGANWTFVFWGLAHALFFIPLVFARGGQKRPIIHLAFNWVLTMAAVVLAWVLFRAPSIAAANEYFASMFSRSLLSLPNQYLSMLPWIAVVMVFEWFQRTKEHAMQIGSLPRFVRIPLYFIVATLCIAYQQRTGEFIYFQF